ncbi:MAG: DNA mismatch endonuclease Vsr [Lentisphaerae bacterium]|nr:DNA mismatch endonuclease Vsr [Lentisphaerota bacterium]
MDSLSKERRSWNMSRIHGENTKPEILVRSLLHRMGYRFRLHRRDLPGKPDIVLPRYKAVVFVHGCFWHRHKGCKYAYMPKSRVNFWQKKFDENVERDARVKRELRKLGWRTITVWECQIRNDVVLMNRIRRALV